MGQRIGHKSWPARSRCSPRPWGRDPKEVAKSLERTGQVVTLAADIIRTKALDSIVEHADIVSEGERRAADQVSDEAEEPFETPQQDRAEAEA